MDAAQETQLEGSGKRVVLAQLVGAVYAMERQRAKTGPSLLGRAFRWFIRLWDGSHNFAAKELEEDEEDKAKLRAVRDLGYVNTSDGHPSETIRYAVFVKEAQTSGPGPAVVVAVRGTRPSDLSDIVSDMRVLGQRLYHDHRVLDLQRVVKQAVSDYGRANVCIAGHSLGAALGLLAAIDLDRHADEHEQPVETHLFNPPFASFDWVRSWVLRRVGRVTKAGLLMLETKTQAATEDESEQSPVPRLMEIERQFWALADWLPHLYLHPKDLISRGYINFFDDQERRIQSERADTAGLRAWIRSWVVPHTFFSLLFTVALPKHLIPSAVVVQVVVDTSEPAPSHLEAHALEQWVDSHLPVSVRRIQSVNIVKHKRGQQQGHQQGVGIAHTRELNLRGQQQDYSCRAHSDLQGFIFCPGEEDDHHCEEQVKVLDYSYEEDRHCDEQVKHYSYGTTSLVVLLVAKVRLRSPDGGSRLPVEASGDVFNCYLELPNLNTLG